MGSSSGWVDWARGEKRKVRKILEVFLPLEFPHSTCRSHSPCEEGIWVFKEKKNGKLGLSHCTIENWKLLSEKTRGNNYNSSSMIIIYICNNEFWPKAAGRKCSRKRSRFSSRWESTACTAPTLSTSKGRGWGQNRVTFGIKAPCASHFPPLHQGRADSHFWNCSSTSSLKQVTQREVIFHFRGPNGRKKLKALNSSSLKQFSPPIAFPCNVRTWGIDLGWRFFPKNCLLPFFIRRSQHLEWFFSP